jgi:hypothetical protein
MCWKTRSVVYSAFALVVSAAAGIDLGRFLSIGGCIRTAETAGFAGIVLLTITVWRQVHSEGLVRAESLPTIAVLALACILFVTNAPLMMESQGGDRIFLALLAPFIVMVPVFIRRKMITAALGTILFLFASLIAFSFNTAVFFHGGIGYWSGWLE